MQFAPRLRELGFALVTCYPDVTVGFWVPTDDTPPTVFDKRTGWYCAAGVGAAAVCFRTRPQCVGIGAGGCERMNQPAYCTKAEGLNYCVPTRAGCEDVRTLANASAPCIPVP